MMWYSLLIVIVGLVVSSVSSQGCPEVDPNSFGICPEDCSNDSDCTNGQLCCSNGCGHVCMEPAIDPCATVRCAAPMCHELAAGTITPEGECCPVCACSTLSGKMVAAGSSFMNDCNTCSCLDDGLALCTLIACLQPNDTIAITDDTPSTSTPPTLPSPPTAMMVCPDTTGQIGTCDVRCTDDSNCTKGQMCCSNGCGYACMDAVLSCAAVSCIQPACIPPSVSVTPEGSCCPVCEESQTATCPTVQTSSKAASDCANECTSNDDCQFDKICCSNECGGTTCSDSVEMCQLIQCDWPVCPDDAQPVTSPFSCCPGCPTSSNPVTGGDGDGDGDGGSGLTSVASLVIVIMCGVASLVF